MHARERTFHLAFLAIIALCAAGCGAPSMPERLDQARLSLAQVNTLAARPTPEQIKAAKGIALLSIVQAGVGIGGEGGGGIVLQRVGSSWGAPFAVDVAAGTLGLQLGGQGKDVMILFHDDDALKQFVIGGMQLQAVGEGTFGAATGNTLAKKPASLFFIKAQGIFGGLELGGLNVTPANSVNAATYTGNMESAAILSGKTKEPEGTARLIKLLDAMQ